MEGNILINYSIRNIITGKSVATSEEIIHLDIMSTLNFWKFDYAKDREMASNNLERELGKKEFH